MNETGLRLARAQGSFFDDGLALYIMGAVTGLVSGMNGVNTCHFIEHSLTALSEPSLGDPDNSTLPRCLLLAAVYRTLARQALDRREFSQANTDYVNAREALSRIGHNIPTSGSQFELPDIPASSLEEITDGSWPTDTPNAEH